MSNFHGLPAEYLAAKFIGPKRTLELDDVDCLWAARGILGEGGPHVDDETMGAYLWAILRRCLLMPNTLSYGAMWQEFSQPINPKWRADGKFCKPGGAYCGRAECDPSRLARRERFASMHWDKIPTQIAGHVLAFGMGLIYAPKITEIKQVKISNWASYPGVEEKFPWGLDIGGEWFFEDQNLLDGDIKSQVIQ